MRKLNLLLGITGIFFVQINASAQGLYIGAGGGYGFPAGLQPFNDYGNNGSTSYTDNYNANTQTTTTTTTTNNISKSFSLGSGGVIGMYGGYMLTKNIGFELGIGDKLSSTTSSAFTASENYVETGGAGLAGSETWSHTYTLTSGGSLQITPAVRLTVGNSQIHPYMVTGLVIGTAPSTTLEDQMFYNTSNQLAFGTSPYSQDLIYTISGGAMLGFHGAIGALYMFSDNLGISAEIFGNFMNWSPKKAVITTLTYNDADSSGNQHFLTENGLNKEIDYVSSATTTTTNGANPSPLTPQQHTQIYMPFSSYGIRISIHYNFGGGSSKVTAEP
ncbi:MAG: hypothetical protein ACLQQ4_03395 [Bacteroidia bacterium]